MSRIRVANRMFTYIDVYSNQPKHVKRITDFGWPSKPPPVPPTAPPYIIPPYEPFPLPPRSFNRHIEYTRNGKIIKKNLDLSKYGDYYNNKK